MHVINAGSGSLDCSSDVLQRYQGLVGLFLCLEGRRHLLAGRQWGANQLLFSFALYAYCVVITLSLYRSC